MDSFTLSLCRLLYFIGRNQSVPESGPRDSLNVVNQIDTKKAAGSVYVLNTKLKRSSHSVELHFTIYNWLSVMFPEL